MISIYLAIDDSARNQKPVMVWEAHDNRLKGLSITDITESQTLSSLDSSVGLTSISSDGKIKIWDFDHIY